MKKLKLINTIIVIVSITSLVSCGNLRKEAADKIVEELNNRYDKSFVIDSMGNGWGSSDDTTIKAWVYEDGHKDEMFKAAIKKDFSEVKDEYQLLLIDKKLEEELTKDLEPIFGEVFIDVHLGNVMTSNNKDYTDFKDYFNENEYAGLSVSIYIKTTSDIDKDLESRKIYEFLSSYKYIDYNRVITTFFVKEDVFNKIEVEYKKKDDNGKYYRDIENIYNYSYLDCKKDDYLNLEKIKESFQY